MLASCGQLDSDCLNSCGAPSLDGDIQAEWEALKDCIGDNCGGVAPVQCLKHSCHDETFLGCGFPIGDFGSDNGQPCDANSGCIQDERRLVCVTVLRVSRCARACGGVRDPPCQDPFRCHYADPVTGDSGRYCIVPP
jgi:hypothetical protein